MTERFFPPLLLVYLESGEIRGGRGFFFFFFSILLPLYLCLFCLWLLPLDDDACAAMVMEGFRGLRSPSAAELDFDVGRG